jgi:hypothetical protein
VDAAPDERREEVEVRPESIDGPRVEIDSLGITLSPLDAVDVDKRLRRPGTNLMAGRGFSMLFEGRRSR